MGPVILILVGMALMGVLVAIYRRNFSFAAQRPVDYDGTDPRFDLRTHLNGPHTCDGVIYGPTGRIASRFRATFDGAWDGNRGTITEKFHYDSGATQDRQWRLEVQDDGRINGEADDVKGAATGQHAGFGVQLTYRLILPEDAGGHVLSATDWMYLSEQGFIVNRSEFRKFGFKVAEIVAIIRPRDAE